MRYIAVSLIAALPSVSAIAWDPIGDMPGMSIGRIIKDSPSGVAGEETKRTTLLQAENSSLRQLVSQQQNMLRLQEERIRILEGRLTALEAKK